MSLSIVLKESMSGWLQINGEERAEFSFDIKATSQKLFMLTAPRPFTGTAYYGPDKTPLPIHGELTILLNGPRYDFIMPLQDVGDVRIAGKKQYQLSNLKTSLTTCPLTVYQQGDAIGTASVTYRDSLLRFPFTALSLSR